MPAGSKGDERIFVVAPLGRDARLAARIFESVGIAAEACVDVAALGQAIEQGAGAAFVTEEVLTHGALQILSAALETQPAWSDIPLIVATSAGEISRLSLGRVRALERACNVLLVERPMRSRTLASAAQSALRARRRQYQVRDLLAEREQLLDSERAARTAAENANQLKDEFLATLSHELRTPLNAILGWADMLARGVRDEETRERGLETIRRNAKTQATLIEDVLDVARIVSGKLQLRVQAVNLTNVIEAALDSLRLAADAKGVSVLVYPPAPGVLTVNGDFGRLQQVVWNLVSNAVKFTPCGGRIDVRCAREASALVITVRDSGRGIRAEFLPHVFDRFRQEDGSFAREHGGLGLGLAIVRHLVEAHGGTIEAQSAGENQGAAFIVRLPSAEASRSLGRPSLIPAPSGETRASSSEVSLRGLRLLVVDDEIDSRELLVAWLERAGARVAAAASADEALRALDDEQFDAVLSDIGMPGKDGFAFLRILRSRPPAQGGEIPAAAITAFARAEDRRRVLDAGFQMHLPKPIDFSALMTTIRALTRPPNPGPEQDVDHVTFNSMG